LNDVLRKQSEKSDSYKLPFETVESLGEPTLITKAARKNASNVLEEIETAKVSIEHVTSELAILSEKLFSHKELMKRGMKEASLGLLGIEQVMKALAEIPGRRRQSPERWGPSRQYSNQLSKSNCKTLEYIANVLKTQKKIVCLAGAGISTSAGGKSCPQQFIARLTLSSS
jgi:hypothetical protein